MFCLLLVVSVVPDQMQNIFGYDIKDSWLVSATNWKQQPFLFCARDVYMNVNFDLIWLVFVFWLVGRQILLAERILGP